MMSIDSDLAGDRSLAAICGDLVAEHGGPGIRVEGRGSQLFPDGTRVSTGGMIVATPPRDEADRRRNQKLYHTEFVRRGKILLKRFEDWLAGTGWGFSASTWDANVFGPAPMVQYLNQKCIDSDQAAEILRKIVAYHEAKLAQLERRANDRAYDAECQRLDDVAADVRALAVKRRCY